MVRFRQYYKITFLALGLFIMGGYFSFLFAEEARAQTYYLPVMSKEDCLNNFDINKVNFKDPKVIYNIPLLADYFQCRAVVKNDISQCNNLNPWPDRVDTCRSSFNEYHGLYGRLWIEGRVTPQTLNTCIDLIKLNREDCRSFLQAWLVDDTSFCKGENKNECIAMIRGDRSFCKEDPCMYKATYIKAIKTGDIKECDKIGSSIFEKVKMMCQGYISMDENICEKNKGFEDFRNKYCE